MPMFRTLFFRELRAGLVWEGVLLGWCLGLAYPIGRYVANLGYSAAEWTEGAYLFVLLLLTFQGFAAGERTFSPSFKERQYLFLYTLPMPRGRAWLALVGGRLVANQLSFLALLAFGASLISFPGGGSRGPFALAAQMAGVRTFLFLVGTCGALLFRRVALVYLASGLGVILLYQQIFWYVLNDTWQVQGNGLPYKAAASSLIGMAVAAAVCSWYLFRSGGGGSAKQRMGVGLVMCAALIGCLIWAAISRFVFIPPQVSWFENIDRWNPVQTAESPAQRISPSGRYLLLVEHYGGWGYLFRLKVLDIETARFTGQWTGSWLLWAGWSNHGDSLLLLHINKPWLDPAGVVHGNSALVRLSASLDEIRTLRLEGFSLAVDQRGTRGQVIKSGFGGENRFWVVNGNTMREFVTSASPKVPPFLEPGATATSALGRVLSPPQAPSGEPWPGQFLLPSRERLFVLTRTLGADTVYFIADSGHHSTLLVYRPKGAGWKKLVDGLPAVRPPRVMDPYSTELLRERMIRESGLVHVSSLENLALYAPDSGESGRVALYDGGLEREITVQACPQGDRVSLVRMIDGGGRLRTPIRISCDPGVPHRKSTVRHFLYRIGSGQLTAVHVAPLAGQELAYLDERTALWYSTSGWTVARDGKARRLLPQAH
jgi:hypothetical protein